MQRSPAALARLGLRAGEPIRFRRNGTGRLVIGKVLGVEAGGSILLRDPDGSARSLRAEAVEIKRPGSRGRLRWSVVSDVAVTWEQLEMFGTDSAAQRSSANDTTSLSRADRSSRPSTPIDRAVSSGDASVCEGKTSST